MIPNLLSEVEACKKAHPVEWAQAHTGSPQTDDFIKLLAARCHAIDPRFGNNGKRGNPQDISDDALCFKGEGADFIVDEFGNATPASVIDVIGAAGTPGAVPQWAIVSKPDAPIKTAWVKPGAAVPVQPPHVCPPPFIPGYEDLGGDAGFRADIGAALQADLVSVGRAFDDGSSVWFSRPIFECIVESVKAGRVIDRKPIVRKYRQQWRDNLSQQGATPVGGWPPLP